MNYYEKKVNEEIGKKLQIARKKKGYTQQQLSSAISQHYIDEYQRKLKGGNFSQQEIDLFFNVPFKELDESLKKKLKKVGIKESLYRIAESTISHYENGTTTIPAVYFELAKKFLGDL